MSGGEDCSYLGRHRRRENESTWLFDILDRKARRRLAMRSVRFGTMALVTSQIGR
jgi:hypothetical protein